MAWGNASMGSYSLGTRDVLTEWSPEDQAFAQFILSKRPDVWEYHHRRKPNDSPANVVNDWAFGPGWKSKQGVGNVAEAGGLLNLAKAYGWQDNTPKTTFADGTTKSQAEMGSELFRAGWGGEGGSVLQNNGTNAQDILKAFQRTSGRQVQAATPAPVAPAPAPSPSPAPAPAPSLPPATVMPPLPPGPGGASPIGPVPGPDPSGLTSSLPKQELDLKIWETWQRVRIAEQLGYADLANQLQQNLNNLQVEREQLTGFIGPDRQASIEREKFQFAKDMEIANLQANPRNLAQSLMMLGLPKGQAPWGQGPGGTLGLPANGGDRATTMPVPNPSAPQYNWSDASRGNMQDGGMYAQVSTPVNQSDPAEVARWNKLHPTNMIAPQQPQQVAGVTGATSAEVGRYLQDSPYVQKAYSSVGLNPMTVNGGSNPDFGFTAGRHWNTRDALNANKSEQNLREGLASFSGQDWTDYMNDWSQARPKGEAAAPTRYS